MAFPNVDRHYLWDGGKGMIIGDGYVCVCGCFVFSVLFYSLSTSIHKCLLHLYLIFCTSEISH